MPTTVEKNVEFRNGVIVANIDALATAGTFDIELPEDTLNVTAQVQDNAGLVKDLGTDFSLKFVAITRDGNGKVATYPKVTFTNSTGSAFTGKVIVRISFVAV